MSILDAEMVVDGPEEKKEHGFPVIAIIIQGRY